MGLLLLLAISIAMQLDIPQPTGPYAVGRTHLIWVDLSRPETITDNPDDSRNVPVILWYPADMGQATQGPYFPDLARVEDGLAKSGEVASIEVFGLRFIKSHETLDAPLAQSSSAYPVVIFSPGNGTNVEFYAGIADELASYGYIVVGINHPYDVAATPLEDGSVAVFAPGPFALADRETWVTERVKICTSDVLFTLQQLKVINEDPHSLFAGHLAVSRVAVIGHSLGGITAAQACQADPQILACLNFDGIQRGGPFSTSENPTPPEQAFMLITKETQIPPKTITLFQGIPSGSFLVVIPGAMHDNFTDGPLLIPSLLPFPNHADQILALTRQYTLAFLDKTLKHQSNPLLQRSFVSDQVTLNVFAPQAGNISESP